MLDVLAHRQHGDDRAGLSHLLRLLKHLDFPALRHAVADQEGRRLAGKPVAALHVILEDGDDALKADGEAARADLLPAELADHPVVAAAARDGEVVAVDRDLEDRAGVVAHAANQRRVEDDLDARGEHRPDAGEDLGEILHRLLGAVLLRDALAEFLDADALAHGAIDRQIARHRFCIIAVFQQLALDAVQADLVKLVQGDQHGADLFLRKACRQRHSAQNLPVVDVDGEIGQADLAQDPGDHRGGRGDQLDLGQAAVVAEDVDVALRELTEASLLRVVRAPDVAQLHRLERGGQLFPVVGVVARQRQRQVVAQAVVGQLAVALLEGALQLRAALHDLEDQLLIVAALLGGQVLDVLHHRRLDLHEAVGGIALLDHAQHMLAQAHVGGEHIAHALDGRLDKFHRLLPFMGSLRARAAARSSGAISCIRGHS